MLTVFATPKPFTDPHIALIQRNAIVSWTLLRPTPEVILFGDEPGVSDLCRELGLIHFPDVARNRFGTPLVNSVFEQVERRASRKMLCYVNADIILMNDFARAVDLMNSYRPPFLLGGQPWDLDIQSELKFGVRWEAELRQVAERRGTLRYVLSTDYFVYSRGLWSELQPFALGRAYFDNALLFSARRRGAKLIDATRVVVAVHQSHGYPAELGGENQLTNVEARENIDLAGGRARLYCWNNATHRLTPAGPALYFAGLLRILGPFSPTLARWRSYWYVALKLTRPVRHALGIRAGRVSRRSLSKREPAA